MTSFLMRALIVCGLLASYPLARVLAPQAGWENGLIENIQLMVLAAGMLAPLWAVMLARELSWGGGCHADGAIVHSPTDRACLFLFIAAAL